MKVLVQNLQKRGGLATRLFEEHGPDVMLLQEIHLPCEPRAFPACHVSSLGYGTAIGSELEVADVKRMASPYAEFGGVIHKKTTVATVNSIQFVSFHGYNGQPFKNTAKLVAHVEAALSALSPGPAVFAGDFNTWSRTHLEAATSALERAGFRLAFSWPYPGRDDPLDHAFLRGMELESSRSYACASDHRGAVLELRVAEGAS